MEKKSFLLGSLGNKHNAESLLFPEKENNKATVNIRIDQNKWL